MARWANLTKTSAGGEGTKAAAPDRFEDNGRARGLFEIRFAQVRRLRRSPDGRRGDPGESFAFARALVTPLRADTSGARHTTCLRGTRPPHPCPNPRGSRAR